jgi:hypothetical protein
MAQPYISPFVDQIDDIPDESILYRLIHPDWVDWGAQAATGGGPRLKRVAFQDYGKARAEQLGYAAPCLSVAVHQILVARGHEPAEILQLHGLPETYGVAWFTAGAARALGAGKQGIMLRPEPNLPWHAVVFCMTREKKNDAIEKGLAEAAQWLRLPVKPLS